MADGDISLEEINGIKPKRLIADGEEVEAPSQTSNSVYKIKRTWDHYYCTCPAWRNQGGVPVNARSCKHLKAILGEKYEAARVKAKNPDGPPPSKSKAKASSSKSKPASKAGGGKRKRRGNDDEEDDEPVKKKTRSTRSTAKGKKEAEEEEEDDEEDEGGDDDDDEEAPPAKSKAPDVLLATKWDIATGPDPTSWWMSEKLDGVRVYYDGKRMISRLGNPFTPPKWFIEVLPKDVILDGELFGGRGEFQSTVSIVKTINSPHWKNITFQIFDVPSLNEPFEDRMDYLNTTFGDSGSQKCDHLKVVAQTQVRNREHVLEELKNVERQGGEGLMLRKPASLYEGKRSNTLQKVKTFFDAEAKVVGYDDGKGKNKGVVGALKCVMANGKKFNVGTGLSDKQRRNPPKIGAIITYRFQELTLDGVPRFPSFIGEAFDKTEPMDAQITKNSIKPSSSKPSSSKR